MSNQANFGAQWAQMIERVQEHLEGFAYHAEQFTRDESKEHWEDDSGSARDSITAYVVGKGDHEQNYGAERWAQARASGYTSPIWGNPSTNFQPLTHDEEVAEEIGVVLTHLVPYALTLEDGVAGGWNASGSPYMQSPLRPQRMPLRGNLFTDVAEQLKPLWTDAVQQAFQQALG